MNALGIYVGALDLDPDRITHRITLPPKPDGPTARRSTHCSVCCSVLVEGRCIECDAQRVTDLAALRAEREAASAEVAE